MEAREEVQNDGHAPDLSELWELICEQRAQLEVQARELAEVKAQHAGMRLELERQRIGHAAQPDVNLRILPEYGGATRKKGKFLSEWLKERKPVDGRLRPTSLNTRNA